MLLQSREAGRVLAEQEEHEGQHAEDRHADERLTQRRREGQFPQPVPEPPCAEALDREQQSREAGHEELLELFARAAGIADPGLRSGLFVTTADLSPETLPLPPLVRWV